MTDIEENTLKNPRLKSIAELLDGNHHFVIPSYQRGYRWQERQVTDLLNDIYEFQEEMKKSSDTSGEFYCLQPIVVLKTKDNKWEVIDGQQRLTTIFILLSLQKNAIEILGLPTTLFSLEYETREKENYSSKEFLEKITDVTEIDKTNIDFFRMSDAFLTMKKWFADSDVNLGDFCNTLLKMDEHDDFDRANNVRFIWYELNADGDKPNVAFTKYNRGKIELTNAELIKAIFYLYDSSMNGDDKKKYQFKIGYEWDDIENTLRKKDFWRFINPDNKKGYENHIEFIFELVANKYRSKVNLKLNKSIDALWSFHVFNELITKKIRINDDKDISTRDYLWDEVKTYYRTFVEWYEDNTYYHIIGFLLHIGTSIDLIKKLTESHAKTALKKKLRQLIKDYFGDVDFEQLGYDYDSKKAKEILLLFNVVTTMNSQYNRFAFDRYASENWSLEHIHAQQSEELTSEKQRRQLLEEQKKYFAKHNKKELLAKINVLLKETDIDEYELTEVQDEIFAEYSDADNYIDSIKNLALLTVPDNSCLNNNIFPIKRDRIKELDERGSFIPICTKNVFFKYYSKGVEQNVKWDRQDMDAYLAEMRKVLKAYIEVKKHEY